MNKQSKPAGSHTKRVYMVRTGLLLIGIAFVFGIVGGVIYFSKFTQKTTYTSEFMKVQFEYSPQYSVREKLTDIVISKEDNEIRIGRYGTNFHNTSEHVENLLKLNKTEANYKREVSVPYEGIFYSTLVDNYEERVYFFVRNYSAFYISTDNPSLFSDLDEIVKSFRILE